VRRYANGAALVGTGLIPDSLLALLKAIERRSAAARRAALGLARARSRYRAVERRGLVVAGPDRSAPPPSASATFVLRPGVAIAPDWRDPLTGFRCASSTPA
jgi:2-amino-4-hydroxy-6-hydroxymethyldihydropteridine diphosphokinase